ncbi:hypothetical protein EYZ11_009897 [Aspergillus tanneri]|uniref:Enoyl reductase (ER) domain-containing protein n=1 Tax=Aspergillus tanneri TaxID=1220188 RepID=A0A4S3J6Z3_9EURO|nr:hypothetical protein EYZ11_009897 [Aspergillus tanneri]
MSPVANLAAWLPGIGREIEVAPADMHEPGENELLIETKAIAVQPAEFKIQDGVLRFPLKYPAIPGVTFAGIVNKVGLGVTRFKVGDRIVTTGASTVRNDPRFGAYQRYALTTQDLTAKIGDVSFEKAAGISNLYGSVSALVFHLGLDRPSADPNPNNKYKKVLIWGASSTFGAYAVQLAAWAGYTVIGVASPHNANLVEGLGATYFINRNSPSVVQDLISLGPFDAVLAAQDSAPDQVIIGRVLAGLGGGRFLTTMGVREGVKLPPGVSGFFAQFIDDYLNPDNQEFTKWVWWDLIENGLVNGKISLFPVQTLGGLSKVQMAWDLLRDGKLQESIT